MFAEDTTDAEDVLTIGVEVLYQTVLSDSSSVVHVTCALLPVTDAEVTAEITGAVTSAAESVVNDCWPERVLFPEASEDSTI